MRNIVHCLAVIAAAVLVFACGNAGAGTKLAGTPTPVPAAENTTADTPSAAYKRLFAAVKAKDANAIRAVMSKKTQALAKMQSQWNKETLEMTYRNGFTGTTFAETLPDIREESAKGIYGAVEVWNHQRSEWEDLPFVLEDGSWKLAIGELFEDTFQSPRPGLAKIKRQAGNSQTKPPANGKGLSNVGQNSNN